MALQQVFGFRLPERTLFLSLSSRRGSLEMGVRFHRRIYSPFSPLDPSLLPLKYSVTYIIIIVTMTGLLITTSHRDFGPVSTFRWKSDDVHDSEPLHLHVQAAGACPRGCVRTWGQLQAGRRDERERKNVGLYGTVFYLKNPTPPGAAQAT